MHASEYGCDTPYEELVVSIEEVTHAIEKLDLNKACGSDGICSEHLKYASNVLVPLLAMCFTSFISHGFMPELMLSVVLVPVIKAEIRQYPAIHTSRPVKLWFDPKQTATETISPVLIQEISPEHHIKNIILYN